MTDDYLSLPLSSTCCITGLSTYSINRLVPVVTSAVTAIPGDNSTSTPSTRIIDFETRTRAALYRPNFSSAFASGLTLDTAPVITP
jgi:hypothetical protein